MGSCSERKPVITACSLPDMALTLLLRLLLRLLLGWLPRLRLPGRLLLLLVIGLFRGLTRLSGLLVHLILLVVLLLHGKNSFRGERQVMQTCLTVRGELPSFTIAVFGSHFVSVGLTYFHWC